jgi:serine/threonine-protein kinase
MRDAPSNHGAHAATLPACIGRYRIERVLGRGAMGVVYLAFDPKIERKVALKTIRHDLLHGASGERPTDDPRQRFLNEARAAGRLIHPHIVQVYDFDEPRDETGDAAFFTMEYVAGESLAARLAAIRPTQRMPPARALGWFVQLLDALDYAHGAGVVHRDIKPANLLITERGACKVTDFGIARIGTSDLTQAGMLIGTPGYMSPEQFTGEPLDARADLFSAAVVLYEMLTGVCPFNGPPSVVMQQILTVTPAAPSTLAPDLPASLDTILAKALAKRPAERFQSAAEWRASLLATLGAMGASGTPGVEAPASDDSLAERTVIACAIQPAVLEPPATDSTPRFAPHAIAQLESRLASQVGPVATLLMRRATADAPDVATLRERLSRHFADDAARRDFDALLTQLGPLRHADRPAPELIPGQGLDAALLQEATHKLAAYLGPIAKIIVARAAAGVIDAPTFHARLVEAIPDAAQRDALRRDLGL